MDLFGGPFLIQKFEEGRDSDGGKKAKADSSEDRRQINDQITERTGERQGAVLEYQPEVSV